MHPGLNRIRHLCLMLALAIGLSAASGCVDRRPEPPSAPVVTPTAPLPPGRVEPATGLRANEAGKVMILMYHEIGPKEGDWQRTPANFRSDLERLYRAGYRLVPLQSVLSGRIDLPHGYSPVVLTFDDADAGQFRYLSRDGVPVIDPDCAVGIIEAFAQEHPDFGTAATFYPYFSAAPFRQKEYVADKLRYLADHHYELGNHTWGHANLAKSAPETIQSELARQAKAVQALVPDCEVASLALPYGGNPADRAFLMEGQADGTSYRNRGVLLVGANPAPSPLTTAFRPDAIPRIRGSESELAKWLSHFAQHPGERYVSDGDPELVTVPDTLADRLDPEMLGSRKIVSYVEPQ